MEQNNVELEIDLLALLNHLRKKIWIIIAVTVVCGVLGLVASLFLLTPQYTASTRIYVLNRSNETTVASSDYQIANYIISDYQELIQGRNVTSEVIQQLGLEMTDGELANKITVSSPGDSRILQIDVEDPSAKRAAQIANSVREVTSSQLTSIMQVDSATTIYEAIIPEDPSSPNVEKNTVLAAVVGLVVIVAIFSVLFVLNDKITTEDDVERYLGLSVIGVIPDNKQLTESESKSKKVSKKSSKGERK